MIVNGKDMVAGRLATQLAKAIIKGEEVTVVNAEELIITGNKEDIMERYHERSMARVLSNPHYGPKYDRVPSKIYRRMVKGMLPDKSRTVERLIKFIKVYDKMPKELASEKMTEFEGAKFNHKNKYMTLGEIATLLGGKW